MVFSPRIKEFGLFPYDKQILDYSPRIDKLWVFLLGKINYGLFS